MMIGLLRQHLINTEGEGLYGATPERGVVQLLERSSIMASPLTPKSAEEEEEELKRELEACTKRVAELEETRRKNAEIVERLEKELEEAKAMAESQSTLQYVVP